MYKIQPKTLFIGQTSQYLPSCQSTNDEASTLFARQNPAEGTLIITDSQTAGRGQRGNVWLAQPGQNLTFSLILTPTFLAATDQFWLNMAVSLGIFDTLQPLTGAHLRVKWPNDIYVANRKMGGILIENVVQGRSIACSIVGVGLNINQTEFPYPTATSLQAESPLPNGYALPGLLSSLCEKLEQRYLQLRSGQRSALKTDYLGCLYRYQQEHPYQSGEQSFWGTIVDVDPTGRLVMQTGNQTRLFDFKEVVFL